jgi:hypothetical protein
MIHLLSYFFKKKEKREENKYVKEKISILNHYLKSLIRYEKKINSITNVKSPFFSSIYINQNLFDLLIQINNIEEPFFIEEKYKIYKDNIKNIIITSILNNEVNYDDFETSFLKYFKMNEDDYLKIKEFVKPYYKDKIKDKNILKIILSIFLFYIIYIQFYMIIHEFLEINEKDLEYFIHLFIKGKDNKEKMRLLQKELKYEYFHFYINELFRLFYSTIHLLKDITNIIYNFDIHNIFELKKYFLQKILIKK